MLHKLRWFEDDLYNGEGIKYYENGIKLYEGEFEDDEYNGKGIEYYENENKKYEGDFEDEEPHQTTDTFAGPKGIEEMIKEVLKSKLNK